MTTLQYSQDTDTFRVVNETRIANVPNSVLYSRIIDSDLIDAARKATQNPGDVVAVISTSSARGLKPRNSQRHGVIL